jgi:hypothetical protein
MRVLEILFCGRLTHPQPGFAPALIGCYPQRIDEIGSRLDAAAVDNWFAKSALEIACQDITGRAAGIQLTDAGK